MKESIQIALSFLKFRPRTEMEVRRKLEVKKVDDREIRKTIEALKQNQLLDDAKFVKMWVESRNLLKPTGSYLLKRELKNLGVADEEIEAALSCQNEEELAKKALSDKARYQKADFARKMRFLQRRGFAANIIYKVLKDKQ